MNFKVTEETKVTRKVVEDFWEAELEKKFRVSQQSSWKTKTVFGKRSEKFQEIFAPTNKPCAVINLGEINSREILK